MGRSTHNGHILTNSPQALPHYPHALFLSPYIRTLSLPWIDGVMYMFLIFIPLSPAVFHSLPQTSHVYFMSYSSPFIFVFYISLGFMLLCIPSTISIHSPLWIFAPSLTQHTYVPYNLFPSLILRVVPSHNHTCTPCFTPLKPLFPFPCPTYTPSTFPHSHNHSIHNTIQSFPFTGTHNTAPLPSLSPSTPTSNSLHQLHWDPLINNEIIRSCWLQIELSWIPHKHVHV